MPAFASQPAQTDQYFILNPNDYLVDVGLTGSSYSLPSNHQTFWLGYCTGTANGNDVCIGPANRLQWDLETPPS